MLSTISGTTTPSISSVPETAAEAHGAGATERGYSLKSLEKNSGAQNDGLIAHATQSVVGAKAAPSGQPPLREPQLEAGSDPALQDWFQTTMEDPAKLADLTQLINFTATLTEAMRARPAPEAGKAESGAATQAAGTAFNILTMASNVNLLFELMQLLGDLRTGEARYNSEMILKSESSTRRLADSIVREGSAKMATGISQGAVSVVSTLGSVGMKVVGQRKDYQNAARNIASSKNTQIEGQRMNGGLNAAKGVNNAPDGLNAINAKTPGGADRKIDVASSNRQLAEADQAKLTNAIDQKNAVFAAGDAAASESNAQKISKWNAGGDLAGALGGASGTSIGGGGAIMSAEEQASQKFMELEGRVIGQGGDAARERSQKADNLFGEIFQIMKAMAEARNSTNASIASAVAR